MSETSGTPLCLIEYLHFLPFGLLIAGNDHLCNAFSVFYHKIFGRQVHHNHPDLASVVGIDGSGVFSRVTPFFSASPLRGRICASYPSGNAM
mgnify:CR=1 FL=1